MQQVSRVFYFRLDFMRLRFLDGELGNRIERALGDVCVSRGYEVGSQQTLEQLKAAITRNGNAFGRRLLINIDFIMRMRNIASHSQRDGSCITGLDAYQVFLCTLRVLSDNAVSAACAELEHAHDALASVLNMASGSPYSLTLQNPNVRHAYLHLVREVMRQNESDEPTRLRVFGLDLGATWSAIQDRVIDLKPRGGASVEMLMIDPESEELAKVIRHYGDRKHVSPDDAKHCMESIRCYEKEYRDDLAQRNIHISLHTYSKIPIVHGMMLGDDHLWWSHTHIDAKGSLLGGDIPYGYAGPNSGRANEYVKDVFRGWFSYYMESSQCVIDTRTTREG